MTAYTKEVWSTGYPYSINERASPFIVKTVTLDFSKQNMGSADTIKLLPINAGTLVLTVRAKVITAEGAACTIDIGDSGSANRYHNDFNCNTTSDAVSAVSAMNLYTAADDLIVLANSASSDTAVVQIMVVMIDLKYQ